MGFLHPKRNWTCNWACKRPYLKCSKAKVIRTRKSPIKLADHFQWSRSHFIIMIYIRVCYDFWHKQSRLKVTNLVLLVDCNACIFSQTKRLQINMHYSTQTIKVSLISILDSSLKHSRSKHHNPFYRLWCPFYLCCPKTGCQSINSST